MGSWQGPGWTELEDHRCLPGCSEVKDCPAWNLIVYWCPLRWDKACLQSQEGPTSPQVGWGLAGCYTQSCINPHMSIECPPVWALLEPGAAQAEWSQHHLSQMGEQEETCMTWHLPQPLTNIEFDLKHSETVQTFHSSLRAQDSGVEKQWSSSTPWLMCDPGQIVSILETSEEEKGRAKGASYA